MTQRLAFRWPQRWWVRIALAGAVLVLGGLLGPRERFEELWIEPDLGGDVDEYLARAEASIRGLRPGEERGIVWIDPQARSRTPLSLVYLHGFSADRHEVEPLVSELATELGANAYFARLRGHGRDGAAMAEATVEDWFADTSEAVAIGARIGERAVLIGTSTGGTLAVWAASREEARERLAAVVMISPNFHPQARMSRLLLYPWGGVVARVVLGAEHCFTAENAEQALHWTTCYPTSALLPMMALVEHVRTADLSGVHVPTLVMYSPMDDVVDPRETERVVTTLSGADVEVFVYEGAGDPAQHVLAGDVLSPESTGVIAARVLRFLEPVRREIGG